MPPRKASPFSGVPCLRPHICDQEFLYENEMKMWRQNAEPQARAEKAVGGELRRWEWPLHSELRQEGEQRESVASAGEGKPGDGGDGWEEQR